MTLCGSNKSKDYNHHHIAISGTSVKEEQALKAAGINTRPAKRNKGWRYETTFRDFHNIQSEMDKITHAIPAVPVFRANLGLGKSLNFTPAKNVMVGMSVFLLDKGIIIQGAVTNIRKVPYTGFVYDLDVAPVHHYFANGLAVHNCIFSFMSATVHNILNFTKEFPDAKTIHLYQNYRSIPPILQFSNKVIGQSQEVIHNPLTATQEIENPSKPQVYRFHNEKDEARHLVQLISKRIRDGAALKDIAVLVRQSMTSYSLESELTHRGIAYVKVGGLKLTAKLNIRQFIAFLELTLDRYNWLAWETILPMVPMIGTDLTQTLIEDIRSAGKEWTWDKMPPLSIGTGKRYHNFKIFWDQMSKVETLTRASVKEFFPAAFEVFKVIYSTYWTSAKTKTAEIEEEKFEESAPDCATRLKEVEQYIVELGMQKQEGLQAFLDQFKLDDSKEATAPKDVITVSTVHSAKGLEWPYVFVLGLEEGSLPVAGRTFGKNEEAKKLGVTPYEEPAYIEEERRLFYVAVTRAEYEVHISSVGRRRGNDTKVSRFLTEVMGDTLDATQRTTETPIATYHSFLLATTATVSRETVENNIRMAAMLLKKQFPTHFPKLHANIQSAAWDLARNGSGSLQSLLDQVTPKTP